MSELIVIAGPQAAGKSTIIAQLNEQYQNQAMLFPARRTPPLFPLQESRQIVAHKNLLLGAITMTPEQECEVVSCDLARMDIILRRNRERIIYLDECNIFTIAHAAAHNIHDIGTYWDAYVERLKALKAKVIFVDIPSEVSWERRRGSYEKRLVYFPKSRHRSIMRVYKKYLERIYPELKQVYHRLPFPKVMIDGCASKAMVIQSVNKALGKLSIVLR